MGYLTKSFAWCLCLLSFMGSTIADMPSVDSDRLMVAKSPLIVAGTTSRAKHRSSDGTPAIVIDDPIIIKGSISGARIKVVDFNATDFISWDPLVFFLIPEEFWNSEQIPDFPADYVLADIPSVSAMKFSSELQSEIQSAMRNNEGYVSRANSYRPSKDSDIALRVKRDIDALQNTSEQKKAVCSLITSGYTVVPYLVSYLDDWSEFDASYLSVPLSPSHGVYFESVAHYAPPLMVDAISTVLSTITGISVGPIANGASDDGRRSVIRSWKAYLGRHLRADGEFAHSQGSTEEWAWYCS